MTTGSIVFGAIVFLLMRVGIIMWGGQNATPGGDQLAFYSAAQWLTQSSEEWLKPGGEFGYRAPMYFVYLAVTLWMVPNPTFQTVQIATAGIGVLNAVLIFLLVRNHTGSVEGRIVFWLRGLLPSFALADTFVYSEPLLATFLLSALLVISRKPSDPCNHQAISLGVLIACCPLTKEVAIVYPLVFGGYLIAWSREWQRGMLCLALFLLALVITLIPWMWRNTVVWGQPLPLSYTAGVNLHIGNNAQASGKWVPLSIPSEMAQERIAFGTPQSEAWHRKEAVKYIYEHPGRFIQLGFKKVAWLLWPRFERDKMKETYRISHSVANAISLIVGFLNAGFLLVGIVGFTFGRKDWLWSITAILICYTILVTFVVLGTPTYRDAVDHLLLPYVGFALLNGKSIWLDLKSNGYKMGRMLWILVPVISYILVNWMWIAYELSKS